MTAQPDQHAETSSLTIYRYPEKLVVASLQAGADIPEWAESASLLAIVATASETTMVCAGRSVPKKVKQRGPFTAYAPAALDGAADGTVLPDLLRPLADAGIDIFTISTYPTHWILVPTGKADIAAEAWQGVGYAVSEAPITKPSKR